MLDRFKALSTPLVADADGALFLPAEQAEALLETAARIHLVEREQAHEIAAGRTLREQLRFDAYLSRRAEEPGHGFRDHLREIGGAVEE